MYTEKTTLVLTRTDGSTQSVNLRQRMLDGSLDVGSAKSAEGKPTDRYKNVIIEGRGKKYTISATRYDTASCYLDDQFSLEVRDGKQGLRIVGVTMLVREDTSCEDADPNSESGVGTWTPTEAQVSALRQRVATFTEALEKGDYTVGVDMMPPKVLQTLATAGGVTIEEVSAMAERGTRMVMASAESFEMPVDHTEYRTTASGTQYMLIPTFTVVAKPGLRAETQGTTLVFEEEGTLYMMAVSRPRQVALLVKAYPDFAGVEIPEFTNRALE